MTTSTSAPTIVVDKVDQSLTHPDYYDSSSDEEGSPRVVFLDTRLETADKHRIVAQEKLVSTIPGNPLQSDFELEAQAHSIPSVPASSKPSHLQSPKLLVWIVLNVLATIAIVFVNKSIFDDPSFRNAQLSFASFHFFITFWTLHVVSLPRFAFFERRRAGLLEIAPLAGAMCLNVILPNLSLVYSSVTFYQTARVLLTPVVAGLNFLLYNLTIPKQAAYTLVPVCVGVAMVTYYDVKPGAVEEDKNTSILGVIFAMTGVLASSIYTVWIASFPKRLEMNSVQLLHNQSLVGAVLLLYVIPLVDTLPVIWEVEFSRWMMILLSGSCACVINLSQFIIITEAGPVASTVVGHSKTISIVVLSWMVSKRPVDVKSSFGVVIAIGGIVLYTLITKRCKDRSMK